MHISIATPLAVVAAVALGAVLGYRALQSTSTTLTVSAEVSALSNWRPASHVLLEISRSRLLTEAPALGASLLDIDITGDLR